MCTLKERDRNETVKRSSEQVLLLTELKRIFLLCNKTSEGKKSGTRNLFLLRNSNYHKNLKEQKKPRNNLKMINLL